MNQYVFLFLLMSKFSHYVPLTSEQDDCKIRMKSLVRNTKEQITEESEADILELPFFNTSVVNAADLCKIVES